MAFTCASNSPGAEGRAVRVVAAVGRSAWSLSSFGPLECSALDGDATATLAAIATAQRGAANSITRLRMWFPFGFGPRRARAEEAFGLGVGERLPPGTTRVALPGGNASGGHPPSG